MGHHLKYATLFFLFFCFTPPLTAQVNAFDRFVQDSLELHIKEGMARWDIPGVAVAVVKGDKVIFSQGFGYSDLASRQLVDENTLFMIGSNTKAFTGTVLAGLVSDKKCNLNDPVQKWLPTFTMKDEWVARHLSLADIVSHRIGMETFQGDFTYWTSTLTSEQVINKFGKFTPKYDFRSRWGYTNAGFVLAGACINSISGKSWEDNIRERIFQPLDMTRSMPRSAEVLKTTNVAQPYSRVSGKTVRTPFAIIDNLGPAGSIGSSAHDMSHWLLAQLDQGDYKGKIPPAVRKLTRQPLSILGRTSTEGRHFILYGMGWLLEDYRGKEIVSHTGGVNGYVTAVTLIPESNIGFVILTNTDANSFYQSLNATLLDAATDAPYADWDKAYYSESVAREQALLVEIKTWRDSAAMALPTALSLDQYTGRYENEMYGFVELKKDKNTLLMTFENHTMNARLEPMGKNRFLCTYSDQTMGVRVFDFVVKNNKVEYFTLSVADFVEFTTYEFWKK